ncbi:family 55 glycoside hydrolase [Cryphonectria parasitica EP155]|uniref:Family 55 glycoside hydrolase n=1 Tax=Cryphonectria parasitica (strain ATCC 38755 / EP155) TaxID=660469 RepID=A0A9P4YA56_CRYP1|nr:family 55 glycoside hydrolase [Cryphonectria parasitica EP155]KAF3768855.1 family 55 glycoside hydrolase [Cryphonectria parasitica EP155]
MILPIILGISCLAQLASAYWMDDIAHQGVASFNPHAAMYQVFRNVKDYGAVGDGVADDTAAINAAISNGGRCGFDGACSGSTTTPATVYFPEGTYLVSSALLVTYYTQMIGDPTAMPVIKASPSFNIDDGIGVIESDKYNNTDGQLNYVATNVFCRQVRNLVIDTTDMSPTINIAGIHWPAAQATSIQNVVFQLSQVPGNQHVGIFMEGGSGGYMGDLTFYGGMIGAQFGNQQYTTRNLTFVSCHTAILQLWDWYWVYKDLTIVDCNIGINLTAPSVGSAIILDSVFIDTPMAIVTNYSSTTDPGKMQSRGTLLMENVSFGNVTSILQEGTETTLLQGTAYNETLITGKGNVYTPTGPDYVFSSPGDWFPEIQTLKNRTQYYVRSKPQYDDVPASLFVSARSFGVKGDGITDDTSALNSFFSHISENFDSGYIGFIDAGYYKVSDTIKIRGNTRIVGEALASVIMGSGPNFSDMNSPRPVVQVGEPGEKGYVEWSDMFVSTQGGTSGAVLIEYNLGDCDCNQGPSGMWDVHIRVGGFAGSKLQMEQCPKTPNQTNVIYSDCIAAYMGMHITKGASNLYMENTWFWVADHDMEDFHSTQITVFGGRGFLIESQDGPIWAYASAAEHWTLYQYQLYEAQNIWMGQIQTETPYYQPNPPAPYPFDIANIVLNDPDFGTDCASLIKGAMIPGANLTAPCEMAWGLRIIDSNDVVIYGPGLYSFFNNYNTTCSNGPYGGSMRCQSRMVWIQDTTGASGNNVVLYDLNTIGTISMVTYNGSDVALWKDNWNVFGETLAIFQGQV